MTTINTVTHVHGPRGWAWPRQPDEAQEHLASCHSLEDVSYRDAVAIHQDRHDYVRAHTHSQVPNPLDPDAWYWPRSQQEAIDHLGTHHGEPGLDPADSPVMYHGDQHRKDPKGERLAQMQAERDPTRTRAGLQAENAREQTALYRDTMTTNQDADRQGFVPGETVEVHAMGYWYTGTVKKATPKTVTVTYTSGTGVTRDKTVSNPTRPDMADLDPHNAGQVLVRHPGQVMP